MAIIIPTSVKRLMEEKLVTLNEIWESMVKLFIELKAICDAANDKRKSVRNFIQNNVTVFFTSIFFDEIFSSRQSIFLSKKPRWV